MFVYIIYRKKEKVNYFLFYFTGIFKKCFFLYNSLIQITDYLKKETSIDTPLRHQNLKKLKTLFLSTLYISAFTFGGGFVIVGFMRRKFVHDLHWIDEEEMLDFAALAQSCPGAVAVNAAILIGWKICGFAGMLTAVLGTILPPMIILSVISLFYSAFASSPLISAVLHGMEAGVAATVLDVACDLGMATVKTKSSLSVFIMAGAFVLNFVFHVSVIYIILAAAVIGTVRLLIIRRFHREVSR